MLSGVIRNSLNGSEVLVNHGGLRRLGLNIASGLKEVKEKRSGFGYQLASRAGRSCAAQVGVDLANSSRSAMNALGAMGS